MNNKDWITDIYRNVAEYRALCPNEKIIIQVSPLMWDYLHCYFIDSDRLMLTMMKEKKVDTDTPKEFTLFGHVLEMVDDPDMAAFGSAGENAMPMPALAEMGSVWGAWDSAIALIIQGELSPEQALTDAQNQIQELIAGALAGMVNVPGSWQAAAGCPADWAPDCEITALEEVDGLYVGTFSIPAGSYEAKVALDGSWAVNFGVDGIADGDNYTFELAEDGEVTFTFDPETNLLEIEVP